jgi:hypothetical protein
MPSISIRKEIVPLGAILIHSDSSKPVGYSNETSLYSRFIKGTPTAGTTPGGTEGSDTHTHCAAGSHNHTTGGTSHTHTKTSGIFNAGPNMHANSCGQTCAARFSHVHVMTSGSSAPTPTVESVGSHTHDAQNHHPVHKTQFFLNHSETSVNLRRKALGQHSIFMWGKSLSCLPTRYAKEDNFDSQYLKGVAGSCSTPNVSGGSNTHTHDAHSSHVHCVSLPAHNHTTVSPIPRDPSCLDTGLFTNPCGTGGYTTVAHPHPVGTASFDCSSATAVCSPSACSAAHDSPNHEPTYKSIYYVKQQSIGLRDGGVPPGGIVLWVDAVGCNLPACWQVGDGNNGTTNMLSKYPKGEAGCSPGTTGGSDTHTHASGGGSHTHGATSVAHTHPTSGCTGPGGGGTVSGGSSFPADGHTHPYSGSSSTSGPSPTLTSATDAHTHGSKNSQPPTTLVAMIERLAP